MLREILPGLIGGMIATGLGAVALRSQKLARLNEDGWMQLRPSWMIHTVVGGCLGFVLVIAYFFAGGGSARADASEQNFYALVLMLGFGGAGIYALWTVYLRKICWRGNDIRLTTPFRGVAYYRFTDVVDVGVNMDGSEYKLHFHDGRMLRVNVYLHGFHQFVRELTARLRSRNGSSVS